MGEEHSNSAKIHQFYESLSFTVQVLETLGKLEEVNGKGKERIFI